jgi:hypothetical protein
MNRKKNLYIQDAVRLKVRTVPKQPSNGVVVTLIAPDKTEILTDQPMGYDSSINYWVYTWIPANPNTYGKGRYVYRSRALNGSYPNYSEHSFEMEEFES